MRWLRHWGPAIGGALVIWVLSSSLFARQETSRFLLPFLKWLLPHASRATLWLLHDLIRKGAHVAEYFIFGLLVLRGVRGERGGWRWTWGLATLAIVACYAALDEVHQAFVPTRGASVWDALLDTAGAAAAQFAARWWAKRKERSESEAQI
jgi:VanZ family protein